MGDRPIRVEQLALRTGSETPKRLKDTGPETGPMCASVGSFQTESDSPRGLRSTPHAGERVALAWPGASFPRTVVRFGGLSRPLKVITTTA